MEYTKRTEFLRMFESVKRGQIDVIVVYKWDRFCRDGGDVRTWKAIADAHDCYILAGDQAIEVRDASTKLMQDFLWDMNEYYARDSAEKTKNALIGNAMKGRRMGGSAPYGYSLAGHPSLVLNLAEAPLVSEAFSMALCGKSTGDIAKFLNGSGATTRSGQPFSKQSVAYMLRNPVYVGRLLYNRKDSKRRKLRVAVKEFPEVSIDNAFDAIVDEDTFNAVQAVLDGKAQQAFVETEHIYLLSGLLRCAECGSAMVGNSQSGGRSGKKRYVYCCKNHGKGGCCATKDVNADYIENAVAEAVVPMVNECLASVDVKALLQEEIKTVAAQIVRIEKQIKHCDKEIGQAFSFLSSPNPNIAQCAEKKVQSETERKAQLEEALSTYRKKRDELLSACKSPKQLTRESLLQDRSAARTIIHLLIQSIDVGADSITINTK